MAEFLVELYLSGADADGVDRETRRARCAAAALSAEGRPVRLVRSIFVPEDETCFLLVEADTADAVHEAANRAAVPFERVLATAGHTNHETKENDMSTTEAIALDLEAVKERQQTMWASGDFHAVAALIQPVAEDLCEAVDLRADWRVLDVATGSGNAALAAARRGCDVVGIDYVPALLARGRRRAEAEGLDIDLVEGDAESIPFPDASFDAVLSVYGAMFAPDHAKTFAELARVCRPGGRIGLATWTPDGFIGEMLKVVSTHVPPAPGVASPLLWGTKAYIGSMFGDTIDGLGCRERTFTFRFRSADGFVEYFRDYYGPTLKAFEAVGDGGADELFSDLVALVRKHAGTSEGPVAIPATWLETVATRAAAVVEI
ncbi:MAG TPA: class I SAM-dependent methyltransferase [Gaiella sp.]|nr:class I SAM-dependent methyltransferase [Gaiella sp.]